MAYEYKWYILKINYGCEKDIRGLVENSVYFKEVFISYQTVYNTHSDAEDLREVYVCMHLCDESKKALKEVSALGNDEFDKLKVVSNDEVELQRKEFWRYKWYILRVASNYEEKVHKYMLENSVRLGVDSYFKEVLIPYEELNEMELRNRKVAIRKKCFPGYVFLYVNLCDEVLNFINNIPKSLKVYGFLKYDNGNVPKVISDSEIGTMFSTIRHTQETQKLSDGYKPGDKVKINEGAFQDFIGEVKEVNEEKKSINVEVPVWGKSAMIQLSQAEVERIEE